MVVNIRCISLYAELKSMKGEKKSMAESLEEALNNVANVNNANMYLTGHKLIAHVWSACRNSQFKKENKLILKIMVKAQTTIDMKPINRNKTDTLKIEKGQVKLLLLSEEPTAQDKDVTNQFSVVIKDGKIIATANEDITIPTDKLLYLEVTGRINFKRRTSLLCQGEEENDKNYCSIPCVTEYIPDYWTVTYHLDNGDTIEQLIVDEANKVSKLGLNLKQEQITIEHSPKDVDIILTEHISWVKLEKHQ